MKYASLLLTLASTTVYVLGTFDCGRKGQSCQNSGVCTGGSCQCSSATEGDYCAIVKANKNGKGCDKVTCQNGGVCVTNGQTGKCICSSQYYGDDCSLKTSDVICSSGKMILNINPAWNFQGTCFVKDKQHLSQCVCFKLPNSTYAGQGIPNNWKGQSLIVANDGPCGKPTVALKTSESVSIQREIIIQFSSKVASELDSIVKFKCTSKTSNRFRTHFIVRPSVVKSTAGKSYKAQSMDIFFYHVTAFVFLINWRTEWAT